MILLYLTINITENSGVYRFDIEYGLSEDETVAVSDHYPVYADIWCGRDVDWWSKRVAFTTPLFIREQTRTAGF